MTDVVDLASYRGKKKPPVKSEKTLALGTFSDCFDDVTSSWQKAVLHNNLNQYFLNSLPKQKIPDPIGTKDYVNDLNFLSALERHLGMTVVIFYPAASNNNPVGWIAGFQHTTQAFSTPEMASESYARAFNILLFLQFKEEIQKKPV